jgi:hypothetical protein
MVDLKIDEDWHEVLRHNPAVLAGGATLVEKDGIGYLVAVGSAPVGNTADIVAKADAQRAILKFAKGFTTCATDESREELVIVEKNLTEKVLRDSEEVLRRISQEATGVVPGLTSIGRWRSADNTRVNVAFVAKLHDNVQK